MSSYMANIKKLLVFLTCFLSGLGVLFSIASITTERWVYANNMIYYQIPDTMQKVKYGLFHGTLTTTVGTVMASVPLTMTCLAKENVCAYLCAESDEARYTLLKDIYHNKKEIEQPICPSISLSSQDQERRTRVSSTFQTNTTDTSNKKYINCGIWVTTILFLVVSMLFGLISSGLSFYNTNINPIQVYLSIYGLFLYNAIALFSLIIAMMVWGVFYNLSIYHDVAIFDTLTGAMESDKTAYLGYSYWLNIAPLILYMMSIAVLFLRQYLISKDPGHKIVQRQDDGDPVIYLY